MDKVFSEKDVIAMSVDKLAFVGDAVFELIVRKKLSLIYNSNIGVINNLKVSAVCCEAQSGFFKLIEPLLSEKEMSVYKRGRNAHIGNVPKKSSPQIYHMATGLETLYGYLYLSGQVGRINELSERINL